MKLPLSWLKDFVNVVPDVGADEISRRLSYAGLVVESVEKLTPGFQGVFAAKVLHVEKHPNADKLSVCRVKDGSMERQIVCGAKNYQVGDKVPLALPGAAMVCGLKLAVTPLGAPDTDMASAALNPPTACAVRVTVAFPAGCRVTVPALADRVKPGTFTVILAV